MSTKAENTAGSNAGSRNNEDDRDYSGTNGASRLHCRVRWKRENGRGRRTLKCRDHRPSTRGPQPSAEARHGPAGLLLISSNRLGATRRAAIGLWNVRRGLLAQFHAIVQFTQSDRYQRLANAAN